MQRVLSTGQLLGLLGRAPVDRLVGWLPTFTRHQGVGCSEPPRGSPSGAKGAQDQL